MGIKKNNKASLVDKIRKNKKNAKSQVRPRDRGALRGPIYESRDPGAAGYGVNTSDVLVAPLGVKDYSHLDFSRFENSIPSGTGAPNTNKGYRRGPEIPGTERDKYLVNNPSAKWLNERRKNPYMPKKYNP